MNGEMVGARAPTQVVQGWKPLKSTLARGRGESPAGGRGPQDTPDGQVMGCSITTLPSLTHRTVRNVKMASSLLETRLESEGEGSDCRESKALKCVFEGNWILNPK